VCAIPVCAIPVFRYLAAVGQAAAETLPEFVAAAKEVVVDEAAVVEAVSTAKAAEAVARRRGGKGP
jgi:hypothetical protein